MITERRCVLNKGCKKLRVNTPLRVVLSFLIAMKYLLSTVCQWPLKQKSKIYFGVKGSDASEEANLKPTLSAGTLTYLI